MTLSVLLLSLSVNYLTFDFSRITLFVLIVLRLIPLMQRLNGDFNSIANTIPSLFKPICNFERCRFYHQKIDMLERLSMVSKNLSFLKIFSFAYQSKGISLYSIRLRNSCK